MACLVSNQQLPRPLVLPPGDPRVPHRGQQEVEGQVGEGEGAGVGAQAVDLCALVVVDVPEGERRVREKRELAREVREGEKGVWEYREVGR